MQFDERRKVDCADDATVWSLDAYAVASAEAVHDSGHLVGDRRPGEAQLRSPALAGVQMHNLQSGHDLRAGRRRTLWRRSQSHLRLMAMLVVLAGVLAVTPGHDTALAEPIDGCGRTGPRIDGGQTGLGTQDSALTVPVPDEGTFLSLPARPDQGPVPSLFICHVESGSSIIINGRTGLEVSRTLGDPSATAILDEIAANARVEPVVLAPPPGPSASRMTPPTTGDAGLKRP